MAAEAVKKFIPPLTPSDNRRTELRRLLRLVAIMFATTLMITVVLGVQLRRLKLQIDVVAAESFLKLQNHMELTLFSSDSQRDGVQGALEVTPEGLVVLGFSLARWHFDPVAKTLRFGSLYLSGADDARVEEKQPEEPVDLFVERCSNRLFVRRAGLWLVQAAPQSHQGGPAKCIWTCNSQTVPQLHYGAWTLKH